MPKKARVVIEMGGGLIHRVVGNGIEVDIVIVDHDAEDVAVEDQIMCPTLDGGEPVETYAVSYEPDVDAAAVEAVFEAIEKSQPVD